MDKKNYIYMAQLNRKGYNNALSLIEKGKVKFTDKWEAPDPQAENEYIEKHGWDEFSRWFLGKNEDVENDETKAKWKYPFSDDFENVNRKGLIAIRQRSAQFGDDEIFEAAGKLITKIDAKMEKKRFLKKIDVRFISLVERGANGKIIIWKSDNGENNNYEHYVPIKKLDEEEKIVYGIVYSPDQIDSQGDYTTAEVIKEAAYNFMKNLRIKNVDEGHNFEPVGYVVESWLIRKGDPLFREEKEGSWAVGIKIEDEEVWKKVKNGIYKGLSMAGYAEVEEISKAENLIQKVLKKINLRKDYDEEKVNLELSTKIKALFEAMNKILNDDTIEDKRKAIIDVVKQFIQDVEVEKSDEMILKSILDKVFEIEVRVEKLENYSPGSKQISVNEYFEKSKFGWLEGLK